MRDMEDEEDYEKGILDEMMKEEGCMFPGECCMPGEHTL